MQTLDLHFMWEAFFIALSGAPITLLITVVALLISIPVGFFFSLIRLNGTPILDQLCRIYISFVRGTPLIIQIFLIYNVMPILLERFLRSTHSTLSDFDVNPIWYAFVVFSLYTIAILTEVFRSALKTVQKSQLEAAHSVGLSTFAAYRRIIIPQALVTALPNLCNATTNLIKNTSLCYALSLREITLRAKVAANPGYNYIEAYIDIFLVYLLICSLVEYGFKKYEKKLKAYQCLSA